MARVNLENVNKIFDGNVKAVENLSLDINDKEFMVIVGPSGCGKTTTLRMIAGLEQITNGTIKIQEKVVNNIPPKDRNIAMVFQNYALYPHMTVYQNMAFGLKLRKRPKAEINKRVSDAANMLGIIELLDRKPKALSGGQRQRVALGRAVVRNPAAFLFDEPLSNLDAKLRVTTRAELKALHQRLQTTSIYVTHDQAEAMTLGDRICVMYNGQLQQVDAPMKVYDEPINRFVAGFLGTPPMNFFDGKIEFRDGKPIFINPDMQIELPPKTAEPLAKYKNNEMVAGIRPEHLSVESLPGQEQNYINATVEVIEPLGDHKDAYLKTKNSNTTFIANLNPYVKIKLHENAKIYINTQKAYIFEPGLTGKKVTI
jgi:multiple sugar transport system ATP-binding protein